MPRFKVSDGSGRTLTIEGDSEPDEQELEELFRSQADSVSDFRDAPPATIPESLQLKPQFGDPSFAGPMVRQPDALMRGEGAYGQGGDIIRPPSIEGRFGDRITPPTEFQPGTQDMGGGLTYPEIVGPDYRAGSEVARQGSVGRFIEETAQAPIRIGMMRKNEAGKYETEMGPTEVTTGDEVDPRTHTALAVPLPGDIFTHMAPEGTPKDVAVGLRNAAASFLNFFASPQGIAIPGVMGGAKGAAGLGLKEAAAAARGGGDVVPLINALRDPANRGIAAAFAQDMAKHAPEALQAGDDAMKRGDISGAVEHWAGGAAQLALAGMSAKHAVARRGGVSDASEVRTTEEIHGDVQPRQGQPTLPAQEGGPKVQPQAQERLLTPDEAKRQGPGAILNIMADYGVDRDTAVAMQSRARQVHGISKEVRTTPTAPVEKSTGPLSTEETTQFKELQNKFFEGSDMTSAEIDALDAFDARNRTQMQARVNAEPVSGEVSQMVGDAIKAEGVEGIADVVTPDKIKSGNQRSLFRAQWNPITGKIEIDLQAIAEDVAGLPPEQQQRFIQRVINEERIHSHTEKADAAAFYKGASWAERKLNNKIYSGNWSGKAGDRQLSESDLGHEMIRRRIQRLNRLSPTEVEALVGRERWTVQTLDVIDRAIRRMREVLGTRASQSQLEILNRVQKNIGAAKRVAAGASVGSLRREVEDLVGKLDSRTERVSTDDAVVAGIKADSVSDLDALAEGWRKWKSDLDVAKAEARVNPASMMKYAAIAQRGQLYREAIEAATNTGSHRVEARTTAAEKALPEPKLDWKKNPEVKAWLEQHGKELGIKIEAEAVGSMRRRRNKDERGLPSFSSENLQNIVEAYGSRMMEIAGFDWSTVSEEQGSQIVRSEVGSFVSRAEEEAEGYREDLYRTLASVKRAGMKQEQAVIEHKLREVDEFEKWIEEIVKIADDDNPEPPPLIVGSMRRGMTKAEERRIAEQRKMRELQIAQEEGTTQPAAEAMSERMADEPTTPAAVQSIAQEVLASKVPSFADFMSMLRTRQGPSVQSGQVAEQWADAVWNKLQNATGAELETMVNNLGLRREVFGKIRQGSKTYGLPEGPPDVLTRSGTIADAGADVGGPESARAKAMERSIRLTKKADVLARQADKTGSLEMKQKADILRRTADNLAAAAQTGEGMPAQQTSLFGGEEAARPADYRDPVRGTQRKSRERAISAIGRKLLQGRPSLRYGLNRKSVGPEDVRWSETGADIVRVTDEDLQDLTQLGMELTTGAGTDASTQRIAGGGRFKIKEDALPRSATKRVVAFLDPRTKQIHLVSAYRDGRRGPVFLDPGSVTGEHRTLEQMRRYRPLFSLPLDTPVQNFKQTFKSMKEFSDTFYGQVQQMGRRIGWRGLGSDPRIEGTEGVEGEGGLFMGPAADLARAEQGMVAGARESGADITPQEGRAVYRRFAPLESRADVAKVMADLKNKAQKNQLNANDWLVITAMSKVNDSLLDLYKGEGNLTDQQIADLALQELYDVSQRIQTEGSALTPQQRQSLQGRGLPAEAGAPEAPSPTSRELTMLSRRSPTDISMADPGSPEVPTGADPNRPAGLQSERDPRQRTRRRLGETTDYSGIAPTPLQALKRTVLRKGNLLDYTGQKRPEGGAQIETGGRVAELTPMAETPGPRESYVSAPRKVEITREVNQIADRISEQPPAQPEPPTPQQGELPIGSLRRQGEPDWIPFMSGIQKLSRILARKFNYVAGIKPSNEDLSMIFYPPKDMDADTAAWVNQAQRQIEELAMSDPELADIFKKFKESLPASDNPDQQSFPASLRRQPGRTVGEKISNVLTDFGSIYDKWMVDRLDEYGGPVTKGAVRDFRGIIDRQKELYGQLTPLLDRARRLSGGVETNRGTDLRSTLKDVPRQVGESARAMRAATWMGGLRKINGKTATAKSVDAVEGKIHVPQFARNLVSVAQAANLEIGRLLQAVVPGFVATGKWQRNLTGLGYDIIRMGGGPLWDAWTEGVAQANNRRGHVASTFGVRQHFKKMKEVLDDPMATAEQIEHVNQEMARIYPEVVTHVKHLGAWQEVVHSNLFNYLEQTAQRATHVRAFREQFPNTEAGRRDFRVLNEAMRQELPPEVQRDLDGLIRAMNGHPTDEYSGGWQDFLRLGPQQKLGTVMRVMNQTVNNVLSRMVLTGQMFVQPGEVLFGSTPVKLGYKNYLKAMARVRTLYNEMELFGSVNRVMHDYTFQPNSPVRSIFRMTGNVISKLSMQAALNELQEAGAAATARVVTENIVNGRLSKWEQRMLPQTFKEMGFNPTEVQAMMRGDQTLLSQFQRKASSFLTSGNKAIAEGSRLGANRLFNSVFRFQSYPMMKMNQARNTLSTFVDAWSGGTNQEKRAATEAVGRFFFGNAMQGAFTVALTTLAYGGAAGLKIKKEEAEDEKFKFLTEAFLSSMSGPFYILWRGARNKGWKGVGEQALRAAFPYAVMNDLTDLADGVGAYRDKDTFDKIGTFLANKTPGTKAISTGLSMFGLGNESQPLDQALNGFYRWRRDEMGFKEESRHLKDDERAEFRTHVKAAIEAMRDGNSEKYVDEWLKAVDAKDADSFRDSMRARKVLEDVDGRPLSEELKEKLQNRIGMEAYERLEWYDLMLDQAANGAIPVQ